MSKKELFYISTFNQLSEENNSDIWAILYDFQTDDNNENTLVNMLKTLLNFEGYGLEVSSILSGREIASEYLDPDNLEDQFYIKIFKKMVTENLIIFNYDSSTPVYIVMPEKLAIQIVTDWCKENATNPQIPELCEKLKEKYDITV